MPKCFSFLWKHKKAKRRSPQRTSDAGSMSASGRRSEVGATSPEPVTDATPLREVVETEHSPEALSPSPRKTGWLVLKKTLETVRDGCDLFLPLKAALVGVVAVMELVDNVNDAREGFLEISYKIDGFQTIFSHYKTAQDVPPVIRKRLDRLSKELEPMQRRIKAKMERGRVKRTVEALGDIEDIQGVFLELAAIMEKFQLECTLNIEQTVWDIAAKDALAKLGHVPGASIDAQHGDLCMEGTRVDLLEELYIWSQDPTSERMFWLDGMAGTGKSAITRSLCGRLREAGTLGGSFFCTRGTIRDDVKRILPTLATSLARRDAAYRLALLDVLQEQEDAGYNRLELQVEHLLEKPVRDAFGSSPPTWVWVIDALDECSDAKATEDMLKALVSRSPDIPIKFFITSRPERHIRAQLESKQPSFRRVLRLHDVEQDLVEADISRYITKRLQDIRVDKQTSADWYEFPAQWPSRADINAVTLRAGKLFIYAFTAVQYVREDPVERLERLTGFVVSPDEPFTTPLDEMYSFILAQVFDPTKRNQSERSLTKRILTAILTIREPLSPSALGELIGIRTQQLRSILDPLHAVVDIPPQNSTGVVSTFHASFGDYLTTRERAKGHFIDQSDGHYDLAEYCITTMHSDLLHFNVSGCSTSYLPSSKQNLATIPDHLIYACSYWCYHLVAVPDMSPLLQSLEDVFRQKFLFWVEVLSAMGKASLASRLILRVLTSGKMSQSMKGIAAFLRDADEFVVSSLEAIELSAPHIYLSALPAIHPTSQIAQEFWPKFRNIPLLHVEGMERQRKTILNIQGHTDEVNCVAFSPDGKSIVSGSDDKTIGMWDAQTGEGLLKPLEGHTRLVISVAFSPDGTRIVSGSSDRTIRLWDARTGTVLGRPFEGHTHTVVSVAFSPDGTYIASGSFDETVRVWDARTGKVLMEPLAGHTSAVWSVVFSPDGSRIASCSVDKTIRVWDARSGDTLIKPLEGHTNDVYAVAFSPDGTRLVSGSADSTIRLWDARTGELLLKLLKGHTSTVASVAFSPDGTRIVSGSADRTVRVWDARSGEALVKPLEGHTDMVYSVAFSPDSTRIVSSSKDKTIRVWDARPSEALVRPLEGHTELVRSVAFSPDSTCIASGSDDKTARVWDARTGEALVKPFEGHTEVVRSVAFSPDGTLIVSGSADKMIQVWDVRTGKAQVEPIKGHTDEVHSVAFSPDGAYIVSGSQDETIRVWDARTGKALVGPLKGHTDVVTSVAFSPDSSRIVSASCDHTIRVWDARTGMTLGKPFKGHTDIVSSVAFSLDESSIVSGSYDKTVRVWDTRTGEASVKPFEGHTDWVLSVAFSPDGKHIVSGSADKTIRVWDARTGKTLGKPLEGHTDLVMSVAFSPDGTRIVSGSTDKMIRVWDARIVDGGAMSHTVAFSQYQSGDPNAVSPLNESTSERRQALSIDHSFMLHSLYEDSGIDDPRDVFTLEPSGWIKSPRGELVLWVPVNYYSSLWWPRNTLVIGQSRTFYDLSRFHHGTEWTRCYTP